jgi:hypothetical protein
LVNDKTRLTNRLTSVLKGYFPQVLCWFAALDTPMECGYFYCAWVHGVKRSCPVALNGSAGGGAPEHWTLQGPLKV